MSNQSNYINNGTGWGELFQAPAQTFNILGPRQGVPRPAPRGATSAYRPSGPLPDRSLGATRITGREKG